MHVHRHALDRARRRWLGQAGAGCAAGLLTPAWALARDTGDFAAAWPTELTAIEAYTNGQVRLGDVIDADNVELVQDLVDPIVYQEVQQDRRRFVIEAGDSALETLFPPYFLDATLRHDGRARFDADGNVVSDDGRPWIGGLPFPRATTGEEVMANLTLSWGRHDRAVYCFPATVVDAAGAPRWSYDFVWAEQQCTGLVHPDAPGPYLPGREHLVRVQSVWFTHPLDVKGSAFVSHWPYDQRRIPDLLGYLPSLKRVRRFPANQRFEPYMPGLNLYLSDAWAAGDPMLTWGNYRIIHRGPFLASTHGQWRPQAENWQHPLCGGAGGQSTRSASRCCPRSSCSKQSRSASPTRQ